MRSARTGDYVHLYKIYRRRKYTNKYINKQTHKRNIIYNTYIKDHPDLVLATELNWIFLLGLLFEFVYIYDIVSV